METTDVAIIGAGPAGLAVGACLGKTSFIILEKEHRVAPSWRRHYERLHLHTIKQYSSLPFLPFPKSYPRYVPRNLMIEYLEAYAAKFGLQPRFGEAVRCVRRAGNDWVLDSTSISIRARCVVVASGFNAEPAIPSVPGIEKFKGKVIHSADYVNAKSFAGQSVLIVGMGNSGAEIALDLSEGGARPTISLRDGVHVVPRDLFGVPIQVVAMLATRLLPRSANDALFPVILDWVLGDLARHGIRRPRQGILQQIADAAKIPVIDVGTVGKILAGAIKTAPGISEITEDGVVFHGPHQGKFDAIVLATGYRANYRSFLGAEAGATRDRQAANTANANASIFFVGYRNVVTGLLREISNEAVRVADEIHRRRNGFASTA